MPKREYCHIAMSSLLLHESEVHDGAGEVLRQEVIKQRDHGTCRRRECKLEGCRNLPVCKLGVCRAHGGGRRCLQDGCKSGARSRSDFCITHGGGQRCQEIGCKTSAQGTSGFCCIHGGGYRCKHDGCTKKRIHSQDSWCEDGLLAWLSEIGI